MAKFLKKVGVNFSKVYGKFPNQFKKNILGAKNDPRFWASGISVVMHMKNPLIPAMHFNTRYICTTKNWFGGGMDVTPSKKDIKEKREFHKILKICVTDITKNSIQNIRSGVMIIFTYHIGKNQEVLVEFSLITKRKF